MRFYMAKGRLLEQFKDEACTSSSEALRRGLWEHYIGKYTDEVRTIDENIAEESFGRDFSSTFRLSTKTK